MAPFCKIHLLIEHLPASDRFAASFLESFTNGWENGIKGSPDEPARLTTIRIDDDSALFTEFVDWLCCFPNIGVQLDLAPLDWKEWRKKQTLPGQLPVSLWPRPK